MDEKNELNPLFKAQDDSAEGQPSPRKAGKKDMALPDEKTVSAEELLDELTPRQRLFLHLILEGKKTPEAHRLAGYDGMSHAAYTLKVRLERHLEVMALARNMSKAHLMAQVSQLQDLPITDALGQPVVTVDMKTKVQLLKLQQKILETSEQKTTHITAININRYAGEDVTVKQDGKVIDVTPEGTK